MPRHTALREYVRAHAEDRPGVYRLYGPEEELLYVGKSVRVRSRLLSYFRARPEDKAAEIAARAVHAAWEPVPNEFHAIVLEMKWIQRYRPRYNVEHARRPAYAFVKVTSGPAPRVLAVSRVTADGSSYYGPFPRAARVRDAVGDLAHVLGLRDCPDSTPVLFDDQLEIFDRAGAAAAVGTRSPWCMRADLGSCLGPCCGRTSAGRYDARVRMARRFLAGEGRDPLRLLESRMAEAARRLDFEYAARLRDRLARLGRFHLDLSAWRGQLGGLTFVYRVPGFRGDDRIYLIQGGRIRTDLPHPRGRAAREEAARVVEAVYGPRVEPRGLTPDEAAEVLLVARWFRQRPRERRRTFGPREWLALKRPGPRSGPGGAPAGTSP